ncbi:MAG: nucleotide sugar dehydrogenase [Kineosporiaceae bacterium]|nr:nucleotide sugar dehydrogenase [Aeromicrobium sp.]
MKIAVIGLGKIGLPLAVQYAKKGHAVVGVDVNAAVIDDVNAAREPFPGEAHLAEFLREVVPAGCLRATSDYADAIPDVDVVVVAVPLFVDDESQPDYSIMDSAARSIGQNITPGTLVSFETTLPVGTTRTRLAPILEEQSGLTSGEDFHVVFSPERVLTGRVFQDLRRYPKIVGGLEPEGARRAVEFYEAVLDFDERADLERPNGVWDLGTAEASELTKLAETTYRDVNIALANQFAKFAESNGIDVYGVIDAANSQPYSHIHRPGIAVGGHCIPVYPRLYLSNDPGAEVVRVARATNASMPAYVVSKLADAYGDLAGAKVVVLGAAYRGGVKETAFSGVFATVEALESEGAHAVVHDPMYGDEELSALGLEPYHLGEVADAAVVQTDHAVYSDLRRTDLPGIRVLMDGRKIAAKDSPLAAITLTIGVGSK